MLVVDKNSTVGDVSCNKQLKIILVIIKKTTITAVIIVLQY